MKKNISLVLLLCAASACTQSPAQIALRGQESFSKNSIGGGVASAPYLAPSAGGATVSVPQNTVQEAAYNSVGVSDLAPPTASAQKKSNDSGKDSSGKLALKAPEKPVAKISDKPAEKPSEKPSVNPWTNKARGEESSDNNSDKSSDNSDFKPSEQKQIAEKPAAASGELAWPVESRKIISSFGEKGAGKADDGVSIATADGESVVAAASGEVIYVGSDLKSYGNMVIIKHAGGKTTSYGHLGRIAVDKYSRVKQGETIGYAGATGNVKNPQLFFSLRVNNSPVDPTKYMGG